MSKLFRIKDFSDSWDAKRQTKNFSKIKLKLKQKNHALIFNMGIFILFIYSFK